MPSHQRYCCVCKNYGGKVIDGKKVSMHRFPADLSIRKVWIQRYKNTRPNFVFVNSDQTRLCAVHFVGRSGPTRGNPLPCYFPRADGSEKVYKLSTSQEVAYTEVQTDIGSMNQNDTSEMELVTDTRSPDLSFESEAAGITLDYDESILDVSLRLHNYGQFLAPPSLIRHQCQQTQPEMVSIGTQTDETRITSCKSTQTATVEMVSTGCQATRPAFTFEDVAESNNKVLFTLDCQMPELLSACLTSLQMACKEETPVDQSP